MVGAPESESPAETGWFPQELDILHFSEQGLIQGGVFFVICPMVEGLLKAEPQGKRVAAEQAHPASDDLICFLSDLLQSIIPDYHEDIFPREQFEKRVEGEGRGLFNSFV